VWPLSFVLGVGETAVTIGTDSPSILEQLAPWRIDEPAALVDFGLELTPAQPEERSAPRLLPNLRHGSDRIAQCDRPEVLSESLRRILGGFAAPPTTTQLRVRGATLVRKGIAYLVPLSNLSSLSYRWLQRHGFDAFYVPSARLDAATVELVIDAELGSETEHRGEQRLPLGGIWFNHRHAEQETTRATDVARLLGHVVLPETAEVTASSVLSNAVHLVAAAPPRYLHHGRVSLENELTALLGR